MNVEALTRLRSGCPPDETGNAPAKFMVAV
jgi:hypothetical protein